MIPLIYIGRRLIDRKLVHCFVDDPEATSFTHWPKAKSTVFKSCRIGATYDLADKGLPPYWPAVKTAAPIRPEALQWEIEDRASELATRTVEPSPELASILLDLRAARSRLAPAKRVAFDAWLLSSIR